MARARFSGSERVGSVRQAVSESRATTFDVDDWTTVTRARTIGFATNDVQHVGQVALELLREYAPARPVRLIGVRVASFDPIAAPPTAVVQLTLEI